MSLQENISIHFTELTKTDRKIIRELMKKPELLIDRSVQEAASDLEVSASAIIRIVKKLGYKGLAEFKNILEEQIQTPTSPKFQEKQLSTSVISTYKILLDAIDETLDKAQLKRIVDLMRQAKSMRVLGIGSSGLSAEQLVYSFLYQDKYVEALTSRTKIFYLARDLKKDDLLIIYTVGGNTTAYKELIQNAKKAQAKIVLVTMNHDKKLQRCANELVLLPSSVTHFYKENELVQLDNRFAFLVFSEILAAYFNE